MLFAQQVDAAEEPGHGEAAGREPAPVPTFVPADPPVPHPPEPAVPTLLSAASSMPKGETKSKLTYSENGLGF